MIQPLSRGLDHLGYFHLPNRTTLRRRVLNTTISDLFSTAAFGLSADNPKNFGIMMATLLQKYKLLMN